MVKPEFLALPLLVLLSGSGCGGDFSRPFGPAQGGGETSIVRPNPGVLVDPSERFAWVPHDGALFAVSTSSGTVQFAYSLDGLSTFRLAFLPSDSGLVIGEASGGCPYETSACTRVEQVDTQSFTAGAVDWEGSSIGYATQSPLGELIALSGGVIGNAVFVVGADSVVDTIFWEALPNGIGWSECHPPDACDERLWVVSSDAILSWPVFAGVLATEPDLTFPAECSWSWFGGGGGAVASSFDGRWVALTCGRTFSLFDSLSGSLVPTTFNGPVSFSSGGTIVGHARLPGEDEEESDRACLQFINPSTLVDRTICLSQGDLRYYVTTDGEHVVASSSDGTFVLEILDGVPMLTGWDDRGFSLQGGDFIEHAADDEIWAAVGGELFVIPFEDVWEDELIFPVETPFPVEHLNLIASQDRLAIKSSDSVVFLSLVTGSAQQIALPYLTP